MNLTNGALQTSKSFLVIKLKSRIIIKFMILIMIDHNCLFCVKLNSMINNSKYFNTRSNQIKF